MNRFGTDFSDEDRETLSASPSPCPGLYLTAVYYGAAMVKVSGIRLEPSQLPGPA